MAKNIIESIINTKNNLENNFPKYQNITNFDFEREHYFYGRIDKDSNIVELDTPNALAAVSSTGISSNFLVDFAADAFNSLKANHRTVNKGTIPKSSYFYRDIKAHRSWRTGDLDSEYETYINTLYTNFVDIFLRIDNRFEQIVNYTDFVQMFMKYITKIAYYYPITRSGYISSIHCSPYVSGLVVDITSDLHGVDNNIALLRYLNDDQLEYWHKEVQKFGFMVDIRAPWRLVFNLSSGHKHYNETGILRGGKIFMNRNGVDYNNVFQYKYVKTYESDLLNLKNTMFSLYEQFYKQYSTLLKEDFYVSNSMRCNSIKIIKERIDRQEPYVSSFQTQEQEDIYWLKILLKLRMIETQYDHTPQSLMAHAKKMIDIYRTPNMVSGNNLESSDPFGPYNVYRRIGLKDASFYINKLTKGFTVTKFNMQGKYWHGYEGIEYRKRKATALEKASMPIDPQVSITGAKNTIR